MRSPALQLQPPQRPSPDSGAGPAKAGGAAAGGAAAGGAAAAGGGAAAGGAAAAPPAALRLCSVAALDTLAGNLLVIGALLRRRAAVPEVRCPV